MRDFTSSDTPSMDSAPTGPRSASSPFSTCNDHGDGPELGELRAGLSLDLDFVGNAVMNSLISNSRDVGLFMRDSRQNVFSAMRIRDSGSQGAFIAENPDQPDRGAASCNTFKGINAARSGRNPMKGGFGIWTRGRGA